MKQNISNMKIILIVSILICCLIPIKCFAFDAEDVYDVVEDVFKDWIKQYTLDSVSEDERIKKEFYVTNYRCFYDYQTFKEGDDISAYIGALVYPLKGEDSKWSKFQKALYPEQNKDVGYYPDYYVRLSKIDGEYKIVYIDIIPEGYYEYVDKMKNLGIDVENLDLEKLLNSDYEEDSEVTKQSGEIQEFKTSNQIIEKTSIGITIFCSFMIGLFIIIYIKKIVK